MRDNTQNFMARFQDHERVAKENNVGGSGEFYRLEKGSNRIRILSEYEALGKHFIKGEKQPHICIGKDKGCEYCKMGNKPNVKFMIWILDRTDDQVKLAEFGYSIIKAIGELALSEDWAFETNPDYDIVIKKSGEGLETEYSVMPSPNRAALNTEIKEQVANKVKDVKEIVEKMKEKAGGGASNNQEGDQGDVYSSNGDESEVKIEDIPF